MKSAVRQGAARPRGQVAGHLFKVGQTVRVTGLGRSPFAPEIYRITHTMPLNESGSLQYRIRSDTEAYERVVTQDSLSSVLDGSSSPQSGASHRR